MQNSVLRRIGNENSRIPNFLYIDEFPDFICKDTEAIFTLYRKYKVATVITAQNLAQLEANDTRNEIQGYNFIKLLQVRYLLEMEHQPS